MHGYKVPTCKLELLLLIVIDNFVKFISGSILLSICIFTIT